MMSHDGAANKVGENAIPPNFAKGAMGEFFTTFYLWAITQPGVAAVALVGSHARGAATPESDVDLVILADSPEDYIQDTAWARQFGDVEREQVEDWGRVTSLRVWYVGGLEVEYGFSTPDWAALPLDDGTRQVIEDGLQVLYDREGLLKGLT